jgi:uncharacterized protein YdaU (DUF1376 family)
MNARFSPSQRTVPTFAGKPGALGRHDRGKELTGEMKKPPAYQWYVRDWLSSPTRLSMSKAARSAYRDLLDYLWDSGQARLPADQSKLRTMADCTEKEWAEFGPQVMANFVPFGEGFITNRKMRELWNERKSFIRSKSEAGRKGMAARWQKDNTVITQPITNDNSSSASSSASASSKPKEKTTHIGRESFVPPTREMVEAYMQERRLPNAHAESEAFIDHHSQRRWRVSGGRGPVMLDWKAAVRTWQSYKSGGQSGKQRIIDGVSESERRTFGLLGINYKSN